MNPSESFGFAEATASGVDLTLSTPFVNNAELVLSSPNTNLGSGNGAAGSTPTTEGGQSATASTAAGSPGAGISGGTGSASSAAQLAAATSANAGQSAIIWVSVAGVIVSLLLALHHK